MSRSDHETGSEIWRSVQRYSAKKSISRVLLLRRLQKGHMVNRAKELDGEVNEIYERYLEIAQPRLSLRSCAWELEDLLERVCRRASHAAQQRKTPQLNPAAQTNRKDKPNVCNQYTTLRLRRKQNKDDGRRKR